MLSYIPATPVSENQGGNVSFRPKDFLEGWLQTDGKTNSKLDDAPIFDVKLAAQNQGNGFGIRFMFFDQNAG